jgi:hypothetical protein
VAVGSTPGTPVGDTVGVGDGGVSEEDGHKTTTDTITATRATSATAINTFQLIFIDSSWWGFNCLRA